MKPISSVKSVDSREYCSLGERGAKPFAVESRDLTSHVSALRFL